MVNMLGHVFEVENFGYVGVGGGGGEEKKKTKHLLNYNTQMSYRMWDMILKNEIKETK